MHAVEARGVFHEEMARFQPVLGSPPSRECFEVSVMRRRSRRHGQGQNAQGELS